MNESNNISKSSFEKWADFALLCLLLAVSVLFFFSSISGIYSLVYQALTAVSLISVTVLLLFRNDNISKAVRLIPFLLSFINVLYQLTISSNGAWRQEILFVGIKVVLFALMVCVVCLFVFGNVEASLWRNMLGILPEMVYLSSIFHGFAVIDHMLVPDMLDGVGLINSSFCEMSLIFLGLQIIRPKEFRMDRTVFWRTIRGTVYGILSVSLFMTVIAIGIQDFPSYRIITGAWIPYIVIFIFVFRLVYSVFSEKRRLYYLDEEKEHDEKIQELLSLMDIQKEHVEKQMANADGFSKKVLKKVLISLNKEEKEISGEAYGWIDLDEMISEKRRELREKDVSAGENEDPNACQKYADTVHELLQKDEKSNRAIVQLWEYIRGKRDEMDPESRMILWSSGLLRHDNTFSLIVEEVVKEIVPKSK